MDSLQLLRYVVRPSLAWLGARFAGAQAECLMLATAAQETHCGHWVQQERGPAVGPYQMEPKTYALVLAWAAKNAPGLPPMPRSADRLRTDWRAATAASRLLYYSTPDPLPAASCARCWEYYKRWYNSAAGAATQAEWVQNWSVYVQPALQLLS